MINYLRNQQVIIWKFALTDDQDVSLSNTTKVLTSDVYNVTKDLYGWETGYVVIEGITIDVRRENQNKIWEAYNFKEPHPMEFWSNLCQQN